MWPVRPATAKAATIITTTTTTRTVCRRRTSRQQAALGAAGRRSHECQLSLRLAPSEILCQSIPETSYVTRWVPRPQRGARSTGRTTAASPIHWPSVARNGSPNLKVIRPSSAPDRPEIGGNISEIPQFAFGFGRAPHRPSIPPAPSSSTTFPTLFALYLRSISGAGGARCRDTVTVQKNSTHHSALGSETRRGIFLPMRPTLPRLPPPLQRPRRPQPLSGLAEDAAWPRGRRG